MSPNMALCWTRIHTSRDFVYFGD